MDKEKKTNYSTCLSLGVLFGIVLGSYMENIGTGLSVGFMFGTMYYLIFAKSDNNSNKAPKKK